MFVCVLICSGMVLAGCELDSIGEVDQGATLKETEEPAGQALGGGEAIVFTETPPDGAQIAFVSTRDGNYEIYVMNAGGGDLRRLTDNPALDWLPAWSPDGEQIAFESSRTGVREIYVMNADGSEQRNLTNSLADDYFPTWSPDGEQIAFESNRDGYPEIYVMNMDGSDVRRITFTETWTGGPTWSPDGELIAFHSPCR